MKMVKPTDDENGRNGAEESGAKRTGAKDGDAGKPAIPVRAGRQSIGQNGTRNSAARNSAKPGGDIAPKPSPRSASARLSSSRRLPSASPAAMESQAASTVSARDLQKWKRVQAQLKVKLGTEAFASWFTRCRLESVSKGQITLSVPTIFLRNWIRTHYSALLMELWKGQLEDLLRIDVVVRSAMRQMPEGQASQAKEGSAGAAERNAVAPGGAAPAPRGPGAKPAPAGALPAGHRSGALANGHAAGGNVGFFGSPLDPNYTFATMVEGKANRMAVAAARSVAEADGAAARFNPLFLHAGVGLGKTHLLQSIAWAASARNSGMKILYLTAEYFMWRFASAIRDNSALSFKESLRDIDLLLIDDMQFLQGKSIQQEFCHLLNALIDSAKQVVVAADRQPSELESLDDRVKSRLKGGVALELGRPDLEMRRHILELRYEEARAEDEALELPESLLDFVAQKVASSGRDLEGAFNQLLVQHRFSDGPPDPEAIERMLGHLVHSGENRKVRIEDIQKVVARHFNVSRNDLLSNRRTRIIVRPRQISMYLAKEMTPRSLPEIGRRFGGRDHTTVLHAVRKIKELLAADPKLAQEIELLKRLILELGQ